MIVPCKNSIKYDKKYSLKRSIPYGLKVTHVIDKKTKVDTFLASGQVALEKARIDVSSFFNIKAEEASKYITCVNGERVVKGDVLAVKKRKILKKSGMIRSPASGVVNLSEIKSGIIRILGVAKSYDIKAGVKGKVISVIKNERVDILCEVLKIHSSLIWGGSVQAEITVLSGRSFETKEVKGRIIVLDFDPDIDFLRTLTLVGVKGFIVSFIDIEIIKKLNEAGLSEITIISLEGFGKGNVFSREILSLLKKQKRVLCVIDAQEGELILTNTDNYKQRNAPKKYAQKLKVSDKVQIFDEKGWGLYGKVSKLEGKLIGVVLEDKTKVSVDINNILKIA